MKKIPQLRILATDFCNRRCIYCRPTGELAKENRCHQLSLSEVKLIAKLYKSFGGTSIKITGGDPIFWDELINCIKMLKRELEFDDIELITRSPLIVKQINDLIETGIDTLNFSLDSINPITYKNITGGNDYTEYLKAITFCASKINCKINSVIMKGVNADEVDSLISFCEKNNIKQLKLLDIISDLHDIESGNEQYSLDIYGSSLHQLYYPLKDITRKIASKSHNERIIFQGGLGHPMTEFEMKSGLKVIIKDANNGAWYGEDCFNCKLYPCHDALMALRLVPGAKLQICLLNAENSYSFDVNNEKETAKLMEHILTIYESAQFFNNRIDT